MVTDILAALISFYIRLSRRYLPALLGVQTLEAHVKQCSSTSELCALALSLPFRWFSKYRVLNPSDVTAALWSIMAVHLAMNREALKSSILVVPNVRITVDEGHGRCLLVWLHTLLHEQNCTLATIGYD